jgi:hypothetical protein
LPVPPQNFDPVATLATKHKEGPGMGIELQRGLDQGAEAVEALPHIGHAACKKDMHIPWNADHDNADKIWRSAPSSTMPLTRSLTPEGNSTSIAPFDGGSLIGGGSGMVTGSTGGSAVTITGVKPVNSPIRNCFRHV